MIRYTQILFFSVAVVMLIVLIPAEASAGPFFSSPSTLNSNAGTDVGADASVQVATDGSSLLIAVWHSYDSLDGTIGTDSDILMSRSTDSGTTWTPLGALNANAVTDSGDDLDPQVATDGTGNWVVLWTSTDTFGDTIGSDPDILVSRSTDNGLAWSAPELLDSWMAFDLGSDEAPQVSTDGVGVWVAVWHSTEPAGGIGTDRDILTARSTDNGITWTTPTHLNSHADYINDYYRDEYPQVTSDGAGNWVAVWEYYWDEPEIMVSHSSDNGITWSESDFIPSSNPQAFEEWAPQIATDGMGNWVLVYYYLKDLPPTYFGILVSRSTDNGASWTTPVELPGQNSYENRSPQITTDKSGKWIVVWHSDDTLSGTIDSDMDILVAKSTDSGVSWSAPSALTGYASGDSGVDTGAQITTNGSGNWISVWTSTDSMSGTIGEDPDIMVSIANETIAADLTCLPSSGTLPFITHMTALLDNNCEEYARRIAGQIQVMLASGTTYSSWKAGYVNVAPGGDYLVSWNQNLPSFPSLDGENSFSLIAVDVTPPPYNLSPYPISGDTDISTCKVVTTRR